MYNKEQFELNKKYSAISMSYEKFLNIYYGISLNVAQLRMNHETLKGILPEVKTLQDDYIFDTKDLAVGNIIAVRDSYGNIEFYPNPKFEIQEIVEVEIELPSGVVFTEVVDKLEDMTIEQLCALRKKLDIAKDKKGAKLVRKMIKKQKKEKQKVYKHYKAPKLELILEGRGRIDD